MSGTLDPIIHYSFLLVKALTSSLVIEVPHTHIGLKGGVIRNPPTLGTSGILAEMPIDKHLPGLLALFVDGLMDHQSL